MKNKAHGPINYQALAAFRYEIRCFLNFSQAAAQSAGIEPQQHQALLAIKGRTPGTEITVGALAEQLQIVHHSAAGLSYRLEAHGWIKRSRNSQDAREVLLVLSPKGERLLEKLSASHRDELRTAGPRLLKALRAAIARGEKSRPASPGFRRRPR